MTDPIHQPNLVHELASILKRITGVERGLSAVPSGASSPSASTTVAGISELLTVAELDTGTDTTRTATAAAIEGSARSTKLDAIESAATKDQTTAEILAAVEIGFSAGSAAAPSVTFSADNNTGMYNATANSIGFSTGASVRRTISGTTETTTLPQRAASAAASAPAYSFTSDTDTGMYLNGAGNLAFSVGNGTRRTITATSETFTMKNQGPNGSVTAPTYGFSSDTDCGMYLKTTGEVSLTAAGGEGLRVTASNVQMFEPTYVVTDGSSALNLRQSVATSPVTAASTYIAFQNSAGSRMGYVGLVSGDTYVNNDTGNAWIRILDTGRIDLGKSANTVTHYIYGTDWRMPNITTTATAANCNIGGSGRFKEVTSKGEFKTDRAVIELEEAKKLFDVDPITWRSVTDGDIDDPDTSDRRFAGWVAENFDEAGLTDVVTYRDGAPWSIMYDRVPALMMVLIERMWNELFPAEQRPFPNTPDRTGPPTQAT